MSRPFFACATLLAAAVSPTLSFSQTPPAKVRIPEVYAQYCASCHGPDLAGGTGGSLLGPNYKHGGDLDSLFRVIKAGVPEAGMPAFATLDDPTLRGLAIFIGEKAAEARAAEPVTRPAPDGRYQSQLHDYVLETFVEKIETPWSMAWLPDGRALVTERAGRLRFVSPDGKLSAPVAGTPAVFAEGQGGLMEVAPHPDYANNGWIYLAYSDPQKNAAGQTVSLTAIVRGRIADGRWRDEETVFRAPVEFYRPGRVHFGCRLVFDGDYLFLGIGDRGAGEHAQDLARPSGKIHRVFHDGRVPPDNPFVDTPGAFPTVWSYGQRNPQGLVRHPETGELWETEHGPRGGDELNLIRRGANYGWPRVSYGMNYNGTPLTPDTRLPGMVDPVMYWTPSIAASGLDVYTGDHFPKWRGQLLAGGLVREEVHRLEVAGGQVVSREIIFKNHGRVRDVCVGPDGLVYVLLNDRGNEAAGRIVRLRPVK